MAETIYKISNKILKIGGKLLTVSAGGPTPPPTPVLPDYTIRVRYLDGTRPSVGSPVQVSESPNIWDITAYSIQYLFQDEANLVEVLGANLGEETNIECMFRFCTNLESVALFDTSNVTNFSQAFAYCESLESVPLFDMSNTESTYALFIDCTSLETVPLFDTSNVSYMESMFEGCTALKHVPLFDTSSVEDMFNTFNGCVNVESGALSLYQQASSNPNITSHFRTFYNCGSNTVTGAAELAQIPYSWGGNG